MARLSAHQFRPFSDDGVSREHVSLIRDSEIRLRRRRLQRLVGRRAAPGNQALAKQLGIGRRGAPPNGSALQPPRCSSDSCEARSVCKRVLGIITPWPLVRGDELWVGWSQSDMVLRSSELGK